MRKILLALLFCSASASANSLTVTSASTTPTVIGLNNPPALTIEVTVGSGDTCLVEFSNTPGAKTSGGNWQAITGLSSITANAYVSFPTPLQALRLTRTAGSSTCQMDIVGSF